MGFSESNFPLLVKLLGNTCSKLNSMSTQGQAQAIPILPAPSFNNIAGDLTFYHSTSQLHDYLSIYNLFISALK